MKVVKCMACKQLTDRPTCICIECEGKRCVRCGKINVSRVIYNDKGRPHCPKCFRRLVDNAIQMGTPIKPLETRLEEIEARLSRIESTLYHGATVEARPSLRHIDTSKIDFDNLPDLSQQEESSDLDKILERARKDMLDFEPKTSVTQRGQSEIQNIESNSLEKSKILDDEPQ
jgi:hypothetical protein